MKFLAALLAGALAADPHQHVNRLGELGFPALNQVPTDKGVRVGVSKTLLNKNGESILLTWSGIDEPEQGDWVAAYSPPDVDITETAPIKYAFASVAADYMETGAGSMKVRLINLRDDYKFVFFTNGTTHPVPVAESTTVGFKNPNEPLEGRLALTGDPTQMRVSWTTRDRGVPTVRYWALDHPADVSLVTGESSTYTADDMCGAPASTSGWRDPGTLQTAILTDLEPDTVYAYEFGDPHFGFSETLQFKSAPAPGAEVSFFAFGDLGTAQGDMMQDWYEMEIPSLMTVSRMVDQAQLGDVVLHYGDISYARGYSAHWSEFHDQISPLSTQVPWMTSIGNHERDYPTGSQYHPAPGFYNGTDSGGECGVPYQARFLMPPPHDVPQNDQPWYSFDYGAVHIVMMSTEHDFRNGTAQWQFIADDLANVNRENTPWVVFTGHRPMYINSNWGPFYPLSPSDQDTAILLREHVEPLLMKYKVDLGIYGHWHGIQRTCRVYQEECLAPSTMHPGEPYVAPIQLVIGHAGMGLCTNVLEDRPVWNEYVNDAEYGWSRMTANATHLHMAIYINVDGSIVDEFNMYR